MRDFAKLEERFVDDPEGVYELIEYLAHNTLQCEKQQFSCACHKCKDRRCLVDVVGKFDKLEWSMIFEVVKDAFDHYNE